jgi:hypothetical protein
VIVLVLSITIVVGKVILDNFYSVMGDLVQNSTTLTPDQKAAHVTLQNNVEASYSTFDYSLAMLAIILIIGLMISSFLIPTHPIFLVVNILGIFILVFIGMVMTNTYAELVAGQGASYLGNAADNFSMINYIMQYLPYLGAVAVALSSIIMFARGQG